MSDSFQTDSGFISNGWLIHSKLMADSLQTDGCVDMTSRSDGGPTLFLCPRCKGDPGPDLPLGGSQVQPAAEGAAGEAGLHRGVPAAGEGEDPGPGGGQAGLPERQSPGAQGETGPDSSSA